MVCLNPKKAWQRNAQHLPWWQPDSNSWVKSKKIIFKKPKDIENYTEIEIPCGNCLGCKLDSANSWATRIALEIKDHEKNCFVTLTYNPENLNIQNGKMTLVKKDIQNFIKRLREKTKTKLSYFCCGEYGGKTHRPHAHLIIFGYEPDDLKLQSFSTTENKIFKSETLEKIWNKGFVGVQAANYKTACYTARYVQKKAGLKPNKQEKTGETKTEWKIDERKKEPYEHIIEKRKTTTTDQFGRQKEFILMSKKPAIGLNYWLKNKDKIIRTGGIILYDGEKTKIKPIPRYFKKLWEKENWQELYRYKNKCKEIMEKNKQKTLEKINLKNLSTDEEKNKIYYNYLKKNLEKRGNLLKRSQI